MSQYELNLRDYMRILRKQRYYFIGPPLVLAFLTYLLTPTPPVHYKASSSVKFSQSSNLAGLMLQVFTYSPGDNVATQTHILTSLPLMARLAQHLHRIPEDLELKEILRRPDEVAELATLQSQVSAEPVGNTSIIEIGADAASGDEAVLIANGLADVFAAWSLEEKNRQVTEAREFIGRQLSAAEDRLKIADDKLRDFMEMNIDRVSLSADELSRHQEERERVKRLIETLTVQVQQLERRHEEGTGQIDWISSRELNDSNLERFNTELIDLQLEKERLLVYQTEVSPEVQTVENKIQTLLVSLIREYRATLDDLGREEKELDETIAVIPENDAELNRLKRDQQVANDAYALLRSKHEEATIREAEKIREVDIVEYATGARAQMEGGKLSKSLVGALVGLVLGFVLALVAENMDTSIATIEDVEGFLGVPVLGVVPHIDRDAVLESLSASNPHLARGSLEPYCDLVAQFDPTSPVAEAYRSLRTNLEFSKLARPAKTFVIASSMLEEGKSTTTANLALALAQSGKRTLVVESDLRRPSIHKSFGLPLEPGLSEVLLGTVTWRDAVRSLADLFLGKLDMRTLVKTPGLENLSFLTCGTIPPNPSELLGAAPMASLIRELSEEFDAVLFDSPPVLPVTDAAILASQVDAVLLVYEAGRAGRGLLKRAKSHLAAVRADIRGVVLNNITAEVSEFTSAEHYYTYYASYHRDTVREPHGFVHRVVEGVRHWFASKPSPPSVGVKPSAPAHSSQGGTEYEDVLSVTGSGDDSKRG